MDTEKEFETVEETETTEEEVETSSEEPTDEEVDAALEELQQHKTHNKTNAEKRISAKKELPVSELLKRGFEEIKQSLTADIAKDTFEEELVKLTTNPKKQELIRQHYENSIVKTGTSKASVRSDLEKALAIADGALLRKRVTETKLAKEAAETTTTGTGMGSGGDKKAPQEDYMKYLSPEDIRFGQSKGWKPEMFKATAEAIKARRKVS